MDIIKIRPPKNKYVIVTHGNGLPFLAAFGGVRVHIEHVQVGNWILPGASYEMVQKSRPSDELYLRYVPNHELETFAGTYVAVYFKSSSASASEEAAIEMNYPLLSKNCGWYDDTFFLCHGRCHPIGTCYLVVLLRV